MLSFVVHSIYTLIISELQYPLYQDNNHQACYFKMENQFYESIMDVNKLFLLNYVQQVSFKKSIKKRPKILLQINFIFRQKPIKILINL